MTPMVPKEHYRVNGNNERILSNQAWAVLKIILTLLMILGIIGPLFGYAQGTSTDVRHNRELLEAHVGDGTVHRTFQEQIENWYTRREGEKLEEEVHEGNEKLDRVLQAINELVANQKSD